MTGIKVYIKLVTGEVECVFYRLVHDVMGFKTGYSLNTESDRKFQRSDVSSIVKVGRGCMVQLGRYLVQTQKERRESTRISHRVCRSPYTSPFPKVRCLLL